MQVVCVRFLSRFCQPDPSSQHSHLWSKLTRRLRAIQEVASARAELQQRQEALAADEARAMEDLAAAGNRLQVLHNCQASSLLLASPLLYPAC